RPDAARAVRRDEYAHCAPPCAAGPAPGLQVAYHARAPAELRAALPSPTARVAGHFPPGPRCEESRRACVHAPGLFASILRFHPDRYARLGYLALRVVRLRKPIRRVRPFRPHHIRLLLGLVRRLLCRRSRPRQGLVPVGSGYSCHASPPFVSARTP